MDELNVTMDEYLPLRDVVFHTLRKAILKGELKPGERLMEVKLANKLGVSRTPIREAIRMLELEGLVEMVPRKGASVAKITKRDLEDVLEVRCALEQLAVELACTRITPEELMELKIALREFATCIHTYQAHIQNQGVSTQDTDVMALAQKDVEFHDIIFAATGNRRLIQLINNLSEQMYRYRVEYLKDVSTHTQLIAEHEAIVKNIEDHNITAAKENITNHIYNQVRTVSQHIDYGQS